MRDDADGPKIGAAVAKSFGVITTYYTGSLLFLCPNIAGAPGAGPAIGRWWGGFHSFAEKNLSWRSLSTEL
jgi:hypothetical protein